MLKQKIKLLNRDAIFQFDVSYTGTFQLYKVRPTAQFLANVTRQGSYISTFAAHHPYFDSLRQNAFQYFYFVNDKRFGLYLHVFPLAGIFVGPLAINLYRRIGWRYLLNLSYEFLQCLLHQFPRDMLRWISGIHLRLQVKRGG